LPKRQVLSSEWNTERVREDASGDSEDGEDDDDELPCVIGESAGDCVWRGLRRLVGSSFHRQGAAYRREWFVIVKEDRVGVQAGVTTDKECVLWQCWTETKFGDIEVGLLWVPYKLEKGVYICCVRLIWASVEISEQEWCEKISAFWWQHEQESYGCSGVFLSKTVEDYSTVSCSSQVQNERYKWRWYWQFWSQDKVEDSEVHKYDNNKI